MHFRQVHGDPEEEEEEDDEEEEVVKSTNDTTSSSAESSSTSEITLAGIILFTLLSPPSPSLARSLAILIFGHGFGRSGFKNQTTGTLQGETKSI